MTQQLKQVSDALTDAHTRIQSEFQQINPVIGVNQGMRAQGIPADAITIDCLRTNNRILLIVHDQDTEQVHYQFGKRDQDPGTEFKQLPLAEATADTFFRWMADYFSA